ncbi:putative short-chain dehydrogenase/reductase family protein [Xylariales sp. PMI_506]|nr:putative short-chain dehydrogenase/reductase family protein [Xylariales sp. PMI_506]
MDSQQQVPVKTAVTFDLLKKYFHAQFKVKVPLPDHSFEGQTILVTGASSGMGLEAARHFVRLGAAKVILGVRSSEKGAAAVESITHSTGRAGIAEAWPLDLQSYDSVRAFGERVFSSSSLSSSSSSPPAGLERLDVVVANAGMIDPHFRMAEDNEATVTVNLVCTLLHALLLLPKLRETSVRFGKETVLTFNGSFMHLIAEFEERHGEDILAACADPKTANMADRYNTTKLMLLFAVRALASEASNSSKPGNVVVSYLNPGTVITNLNHTYSLTQRLITELLMKLFGRSAEEGGRILVSAARGGQETHGQYIDDFGVGKMSDFVTSKEGVETQAKLWKQLSKKLESICPGIMNNI